MNVTIDIGNTSVILCIFNKNKFISSLKLPTSRLEKSKVLNFIKNFCNKSKEKYILISSVVPIAKKFFIDLFDSNNLTYFNARDVLKSFKLKTNIKNKKTIGDDRLINIIFAKYLYLNSIIIIDFGTATTIDILNKKGAYDGGVITPGIDLSLKSLEEGTAKLPLVKFKKTKKIVGKSTMEAIQSGFFWGYISMIQGLVKKIQREQNCKYNIILTGGNAKYFKNSLENIIKIDEFFNSRGLNFLINNYLK